MSILDCLHNPMIKYGNPISYLYGEPMISHILLDIILDIFTCFPFRMYQISFSIYKVEDEAVVMSDFMEEDSHRYLGLDG